GVLTRRDERPQATAGLTTGHRRHRSARGGGVTPAQRAVLATSQARDLCLSLQRAFVGPRALECLRAGQAALLTPAELRVALGLAWASQDVALVRGALASLSADRIAAAPGPSALRDVT